jgi:hypothetical protein
MLARSFRSRGVAALASAACASTALPLSQEYVARSRLPSLTPTSRVLDAERIRRSGAHTAKSTRHLKTCARWCPCQCARVRLQIVGASMIVLRATEATRERLPLRGVCVGKWRGPRRPEGFGDARESGT